VFLQIVDTAGQEEYSSMQDQWIQENEAFLLVYSIDDRCSYENVANLNAKIERCSYDDRRVRKVMLVGNKCDCIGSRQVTFEEGQALAKEWGCGFMETSAKDTINVTECFYELARALFRSKARPLPEPECQGPQKTCASSCFLV
jgi:GTPase KRas protein